MKICKCGHEEFDHKIMNDGRGYCNNNRRECNCRKFEINNEDKLKEMEE
jgi:hypothetical protein